MKSAYKPENLRVQFNGSMVFFVGEPKDLKPCQDWLYNMGATDGTDLETLGQVDCFFAVRKSKLLKGLAQHWKGDVIKTIKASKGTFPGDRAMLVETAFQLAKAQAQAWLKTFPKAGNIVTRALFVDSFNVSPVRASNPNCAD